MALSASIVITLLFALILMYFANMKYPGLPALVRLFIIPFFGFIMLLAAFDFIGSSGVDDTASRFNNFVSMYTRSQIEQTGYIQMFPTIFFAILVLLFVLAYNYNHA